MLVDRVRRLGHLLFGTSGKVAAALVAAAVVSMSGGNADANSKYAALVVDANTGKTLFARNADAPRYPASLTKIMTLYIVFEELRAGRIGMSTRFKVSKKASLQAPSKLGLKPGSTIRVSDAIRALVTKSANDVAMVVAENISGSQSRFARRMTYTARRLGMHRTTFRNPHGLPDAAQRTTARDMVTLGRAVQQHFPQYYKFFSIRVFKYGKRRYRNHNRLLGRVKGVDGIKTGYTRASGFNLVSSARRGHRHIVAVVMGGKSGRSRNAHMRKLIQTYLPKASKSRLKKRALVAGSLKSGQVAANRTTPKPKSKPSRGIITASIAPPKKSTGSKHIKSKGFNSRMVKTQTVSIATHDAASRSIKPAAEPEENSWQIQIGAMPSKNGALGLIYRARTQNKSVLARRKSYTMTVTKGGNTLHRARFAGFASKSQARSACSALKKRKFACYTLYE